MALQNNTIIQVSDPDVTTSGVLSKTSTAVVLSATIGNYANDAAAQAAGVPVGGIYRNGSILMVRVA